MASDKMQPDANDLPEQSPPEQEKPSVAAEQQTQHGREREPRTARRPRESAVGRRPLFRN
jgi:hypothetical protein